jgi:uncharacterized membrane protein SpoIIM required for sporulation
MNKDNLVKSRDKAKGNLRLAILFVIILIISLVIFGGGFLMKSSLPLFTLLLGLLIGLVGGFFGSIQMLAYFELDKEVNKWIKQSGSQEPKS